MKRKFISILLITIFLGTIIGGITPYTVPMTLNNELTLEENNFAIADGEIGTLLVPIFADEAVAETYPDDNFFSNNVGGGLWVGHETIDGVSRSWLMFNMSYIPKEIGFVRATLMVYLNSEWNPTYDVPIGVHYAENDSWTEQSITWNNQPDFNGNPLDIIATPDSPDMFVSGNWYEWDVTSAVLATFQTDRVLSLVMKDVNETASYENWKYFTDEDYDEFKASYISIEYTTPGINEIAVDGYLSSPMIDYIQNGNPQITWSSTLNDEGDFQRDYELEVWNNQAFDDTLMFDEKHGTTFEVASGGPTANFHLFNSHEEVKYQMKFNEWYIGVGGLVDRLQFEVGLEHTCVFEDLTIYMANIQDNDNLTDDFTGNYGFAEPTVVLSRSIYEPEYNDGWLVFDIENVFAVSKDMSLLVEFRYRNNTGEGLQSLVEYDNGVGSVAYTLGSGALEDTVADLNFNRTHGLRLDIASTEVYETVSMSTNAYPFGVDHDTVGRFQMKYNQSIIDSEGIIDRLYFRCNNPNQTVTYENLSIYLLETPGFDYMSPIFEENYAGLEPMLVLEAESYTVNNPGQLMMIDIDNVFHYTNTNDLLIEMQWDALVDGKVNLFRTYDGGGYRAWNVTYLGGNYGGNDTRTYEMYLDFIHNVPGVEYNGLPLVNSTRYWIRVRIMDSTGLWTSWNTQTFKYEVLTSGPEWESLINDPDPATAGSPVTVSIDVTHVTGIYHVDIEYDGVNHSMTAIGDTYSYEWTPALEGIVNYTIYMFSGIGTSSSVKGSFVVNPPPTTPSGTTTTSTTTPTTTPSGTTTTSTTTPTTTAPTTTTNGTTPPLGDYTTIIIIVVAGGAVLIIIIIIIKKRGS